ncbi:hypothetical protein [Vagococcus humatus]|uniref:Uncharacterized protein n=1 Tax=Vagococcus humatus TaxID=1889241 RepID=A0A429Z7T2_9ENTE|nr:hypothetical protein [Vagococcus humatus]RST89790.1 hypothetical protein C7P63_01550 [Vagococcus humatus]
MTKRQLSRRIVGMQLFLLAILVLLTGRILPQENLSKITYGLLGLGGVSVLGLPMILMGTLPSPFPLFFRKSWQEGLMLVGYVFLLLLLLSFQSISLLS